MQLPRGIEGDLRLADGSEHPTWQALPKERRVEIAHALARMVSRYLESGEDDGRDDGSKRDEKEVEFHRPDLSGEVRQDLPVRRAMGPPLRRVMGPGRRCEQPVVRVPPIGPGVHGRENGSRAG
jgi:hypothetical protein